MYLGKRIRYIVLTLPLDIIHYANGETSSYDTVAIHVSNRNKEWKVILTIQLQFMSTKGGREGRERGRVGGRGERGRGGGKEEIDKLGSSRI